MKRPLALFVLFGLESLLAFIWAFFTPAEIGRGVFLWLSFRRLLLSVFILMLSAGILGVALHLWRSPARLQALLDRLDGWCVGQHRLAAFLIPLFVGPLCISAAILGIALTPLNYASYRTWAPDTFPLLHSLVNATLPLLTLLLIVMVEAGVYLALRYRHALASSETWAWKSIAPSLLLTFITLLTLSHWIILAFQLHFFVNIPAWYWKIQAVPFTVGDLWFVLALLILLALVYWVLIVRRKTVIGLLLVFLLGWFLQNSIGLMGGGGFATVADRYFSTYHKTYVLQASQNRLPILDVIRGYEGLYGSHAFTSTKPPGLMAFYIGLDQLINGFPAAFPDSVRYERLSQAIIFGFPLVAMGMVFLIYAFARRHFQNASDLVPVAAPFLYVLCPSVVLFSLFPDQAVYPLVFLLGVWFSVIAIQRQSIILSFVLGILLHAAVFFAFTMLPLYPFAGLYLVLHNWHDPSAPQGRRRVWMALAIAAGTVALFLLLLVLLNYNFFPRFERTMAINHNFDFYLRVGRQAPALPETLPVRLGQIARAAWFNNLDFAAAIGLPVYVLFAVGAVRLVLRLLRRSATAGDIILAALLLGFAVLNLAGTAQGETPRLWLFWLPLMMILASFELEPYARRHPSVFLWLALVQSITLFLTYHFQDLRM